MRIKLDTLHRRCRFGFFLACIIVSTAGCSKIETVTETKTEIKAEPEIRLPSFDIAEHFGVSHPDQIITFDLMPGTPVADIQVLDSSGKPVPFQFVDGGKKLALRTDLPAGASRKWRMEKLPASKSPAEIKNPESGSTQIKETDKCYEIVNGITGIRIPKAAAVSPENQALPAPVQGVLMRNGTWTGPDSVNPLTYQSSSDWTKKTVATAMAVDFIERGPLIVRARIKYSFSTPDYMYGQQKTRSGGPGYYICTITLESGQPSVMFDEETDIEPAWSLNFYNAVHPTNARYRGHHSRSPAAGYEPGGGVYRASHERAGLDAQVDLKYEKPRSSGYVTTDDTWRWMCVWDPWAFDSGWYWQAYDANADDKSNLVGIFAGSASRALGAGFSGVGIWTAPEGKDGKRGFGITMQSYRRGADARLFPKTIFSWGLFVGTKADLAAPDQVQPINRQMNIHGGINLDKVHRWTLEFPDPPAGYGGAFMPVEAVAYVKQKAREDKEYFQYLYNADPYSRPLFDAWTDKTFAKRDAVVGQITKEARDMLERLVNGGGIYDGAVHYWHGGLTAQRNGVWIDQMLAEPGLPEAQRKQLKAAAVMFANIVWDDDHAPISTAAHGLNLGTENMPIQQWGYRRFYALFMARHPTMVERAKQVVEGLRASIEQQINEYGAHIGCTHYIGASFAPTLNTLLQVKQLGELDPFAKWPKLAKFAEFYLNVLTPPEPRAGGKRCFISVGDSGTEPSETYGVLGTGFRDADPALSSRLMGAWKAGGKPHSFFFGSTVFMIDERLAAADPNLADASVPGYYSVLRDAWGKPDETALWVINGDHYRDHRSYDHGTIILYALGKPLSVDWSAIYTPHTPGAYVHSTIVPESAIGHPWDKNGASLAAGGANWSKSKLESFDSTPGRATAVSSFERDKMLWHRRTMVDRSDPSHPAILIRDSFEGEAAAVPKVASFNLMATGPVQTPKGELTPPQHTHPNAGTRPDAPATDLPSALPPMELQAGIHRFGFTGRYDVDFDVYVIAEQPMQALIGNWAVSAWGGNITEREERQDILRMRGTGPFTTLIIPWRRGAKPEGLKVELRDGQILISSAKGNISLPLK